MIELRDVSKIYQIGDERVHALDHANLHVYPKEFVSIIGPSGSGKSTLMNIIGCLDVADAGEYLLEGMPIEAYSENDLAEIRNRFLQDHYLMDPHTAVAGHVLREYRKACNDHTPTVLVSTASPYKFAADVLRGITGGAEEAKDALEA